MTSQFGALLRQLRLRAEMTQEGLAERSELGVRTVRGLETGERADPRVGTVRRLADALVLDAAERVELFAAAGHAGPAGPAPEVAPEPEAKPASAVDGQLAEAAGQLALAVRTRWQREEEQRQIHDPFPLPVRWEPAAGELTDDAERTFVMTVRSTEVPAYTVLPGQVSGEHVVMITLPTGYDPAVRYSVQYTLHGHQDIPNTLRHKEIVEQATAGVPLITVTPNGGGRGWYSNWVNPGALGPQNWENFHLDQLVPFVDANLSTIPTREGRAISGHSMGGFGAFHYAEHRPYLFSYVSSFSGGLDLLNQEMRATVVATEQLPTSGSPTVGIDAIFGLPVWPFDGVWNEQSPAQHVGSLRGMGVAMYVGNGGDLTVDPLQAVVENRARETAVVTANNLTAAGIPYDFLDYGDGSTWAPGCTGKHNQQPCLQADMNHFVALLMARLQHP